MLHRVSGPLGTCQLRSIIDRLFWIMLVSPCATRGSYEEFHDVASDLRCSMPFPPVWALRTRDRARSQAPWSAAWCSMYIQETTREPKSSQPSTRSCAPITTTAAEEIP